MGILLLPDYVPAIENSPVDDGTFKKVFSLSPLAVLASMIAYLIAQFIDIRIYHFWKKLTKGKLLWIRNNFSTFVSQFLDTFSVIMLLSIFGILPWDLFFGLVLSGFIFKIIVCRIRYPVVIFICLAF